ncbi:MULTISPECIES: hypothetical protein [Novosphingobium]|uniref:Uncharacterized protein n=1 Tax=Novosphingobium mathurense TaxID=428990 RepID=A0A1U6IKH9_9SPHN|nr:MULTISPECIES: hypothetical protein [Novosphingobium]CDO38756.1 hypothetical protein SPHV1_720002 [Novosphingobium sp. KN65.2]SLK08511.1 hypothetical protein SAMN06295987_10844 [Novosphingobium mathurense]
MQDEHFIRDWNAGHARFTGDLERVLSRLARRLRPRSGNEDAIGKAYEPCEETALSRKARLTGIAVIGGMSAGTSLAVLLLGLAAITYPVPGHAVSATQAICASAIA